MLLLLTAAEVKGHLHVFEYNTELWLVQTLIMFKWLESINSLPAGSVNASLTSHWQEAKQLTDRVCACVGVCVWTAVWNCFYSNHTHTHTHTLTHIHSVSACGLSAEAAFCLKHLFECCIHATPAEQENLPLSWLQCSHFALLLPNRYKDIKLAK